MKVTSRPLMLLPGLRFKNNLTTNRNLNKHISVNSHAFGVRLTLFYPFPAFRFLVLNASGTFKLWMSSFTKFQS